MPSSTARIVAIVVGLVLLAGAIYGTVANWQKYRETKQVNDSLQVVVDSLTEREDVLVEERGRLLDRNKQLEDTLKTARERAQQVIAESRREIERLHTIADSLDEEFSLTTDTLLKRVPEPMVPLVESLAQNHRRIVAAKDSVIERKDRIIGEKDNVIAKQKALLVARDSTLTVQDSINRNLRQQLATVREQRDNWKDAARPGIFPHIPEGVKLGVVGGLGVLTGALVP